ncbi:MAG TPA: carboxypeptidase-like regulatory domain-containing protein [Ignavibacteriaceae bacterium]|nr:carboxypeptidase-like regulatory domain-containing protein [Ignavibacteriaceae bacterium]
MLIVHKRNIPKYLYRIAFIILAFAFNSCNAPRNNPLDPSNPNYSFVSISGTVQTFSLPYTGISGASIYWQPGNVVINTDASGNFQINNIKPVDGELVFQKAGFLSDTINVTWNNARNLNYQINLTRIPMLDSISIYTVVINQFSPPGQSYELTINANIVDKDNDIDSVYVQSNDLNFKKALGYDASSKFYQTTLSTQDMNISDIEQTIGLNFNIIVKDIFGRQFLVGNEKVTRVIKSGVVIQFPANDTLITPTPKLTWQRFTTGYPFTYMIQIYTNDFANSQLVYQQNSISSDSISCQITTPLPAKNYYWVIWVIDQFQNRSRSLPATFSVQ